MEAEPNKKIAGTFTAATKPKFLLLMAKNNQVDSTIFAKYLKECADEDHFIKKLGHAETAANIIGKNPDLLDDVSFPEALRLVNYTKDELLLFYLTTYDENIDVNKHLQKFGSNIDDEVLTEFYDTIDSTTFDNYIREICDDYEQLHDTKINSYIKTISKLIDLRPHLIDDALDNLINFSSFTDKDLPFDNIIEEAIARNGLPEDTVTQSYEIDD